MPIVQTVNEHQFIDAFKTWDTYKNNFSYEGLKALYEELEENSSILISSASHKQKESIMTLQDHERILIQKVTVEQALKMILNTL